MGTVFSVLLGTILTGSKGYKKKADEGADSELFVSPLPWNVSPLNTAPIENDTGLAKKFSWVFL